MLEIIIDAVLLHKARNECIVRFAILNAIVDVIIFALGLEFEVGPLRKSCVGEHGLDDLQDGLVEKNSAVGPVGEQPKPRAKCQSIIEILPLHSGPLRMRKHSAEEAFLPFVSLELDRAWLTKSIVEIDASLFAESVDLEFKQF